MTRKLAWRHGQILLAGEPLRDAVAEFNRYNRKQLVIGDESIANLPGRRHVLRYRARHLHPLPEPAVRHLRRARCPRAAPAAAKDVVMLVGDSYSGL